MKNDLKVLVDDLPEVSTQIYTCFSGCEIAHFFVATLGPRIDGASWRASSQAAAPGGPPACRRAASPSP